MRKSAMSQPIVALHFDHVLVGITSSLQHSLHEAQKMADSEGGWCSGKSSFMLKLAQ